MYVFTVFDGFVKAKNRSFNLRRSSLRRLYEVVQGPNEASLTDIFEALQGITKAKKTKYTQAIEYLLTNHSAPVLPPKDMKWVSPGLGGMSKFSYNTDKEKKAMWLYRHGVRTVISIEKLGADVTKKYTADTFPRTKWFSCFLPDWHTPSAKQLLEYCKKVEERKRFGSVVTHCTGGTGRTGCFLAAWSLYSKTTSSAQQALAYVRSNYNTDAIELKIQYNTLARLSDHLGNPPSKTFDDPSLNHAGGHWHNVYGDKGLEFDPGHAGSCEKVGRNAFEIVIGKDSAPRGKAPYITESATAREQNSNSGCGCAPLFCH